MKLSFKHLFKRLAWVFASGVAFALIFVWIGFYFIDSPKVKILEKENSTLKSGLSDMRADVSFIRGVLEEKQKNVR